MVFDMDISRNDFIETMIEIGPELSKITALRSEFVSVAVDYNPEIAKYRLHELYTACRDVVDILNNKIESLD